MSDLISRQEAIDILSEMQGIVSEDGIRKGISLAWQQIKELPPAQPERKKGQWIDDEVFDDDYTSASCSVCGYQMDVRYEHGYFRYCPHCGADMRVTEGESDA